MRNPTDTEQALDRAIDQVRTSQPDDGVVAEAASRVWHNINGAGANAAAANAAAAAAAVEEIRGCDDYQTLIPARLAGTLSPARAILLDDHCRACVPCRKALKAARHGVAAPAAPRRRSRRSASLPAGRWALAAILIGAIAAGAFFVWHTMPFSSGQAALVAAIDGSLYRVAEAARLPIASGASVAEGERVLTGRDGGAVLTLADGSRVELRERSEMMIDESRSGTTIRLSRGSVIVQAAQQRDRSLKVATEDCLVAVTGTIFAVNHGTKGSRVSVIEGEVRVAFDGDETVLHPGDQVTTHASLGVRPVGQEIAWSRDADYYLSLLGELAALRREMLARVPQPELRFDHRLLDLMPAGTVFFAAVPNLSETLSESYRIATERLDQSPALDDWWQQHGGPDLQPQIEDIIARLSELGGYIGPEVAAGATRAAAAGDDHDELGGPLVLAEIVNPAGLRTFLEDQIDQLAGSDGVPLVFVDDPMAATPMDERLFLWLHDDLLVASPELEVVRTIAAFVLDGTANPFVASPFHAQIAELYAEGVGLVAAVDLGEMIAVARNQDDSTDATDADRGLAFIGLDNARYLMLEQKRSGVRTEHRAALTFRDVRSGFASWLAAPAPIGAVDFISPDAKLFAAFVVKDPAAMLDDLYGLADQDALLDGLDAFESAHGVSLRDDFAATLGGEVAFAIDGPLVPTPSWKLILEVYDPARLQWTLEQGLAEANDKLRAAGMAEIEIVEQEVGGRTFYKLPSDFGEVHYTFVEGYLIAGPSRALVDRAIRTGESGYSIIGSPRFKSLVPVDQRADFSALLYQDMASILQAVASRLPDQITQAQKDVLGEVAKDTGPTLAYAYGEPQRLIFAATSDGDLLTGGLMSLLGWMAPFMDVPSSATAADADDGTSAAPIS